MLHPNKIIEIRTIKIKITKIENHNKYLQKEIDNYNNSKSIYPLKLLIKFKNQNINDILKLKEEIKELSK